MLLVNGLRHAACSRSPSRIGSISTQPCSSGTTIAGQRRCIVLRRSEPQFGRRQRRIDRNDAGADGHAQRGRPPAAALTMAAIQAIAPRNSPGQFGLRPWNTRAAFHTMPQAMKPSALSASDSVSPSERADQRPQRHRRWRRADRRSPTISAPGCSPACRKTAAWPRASPQPSWQRDKAWRYRATWATRRFVMQPLRRA